MKIINLFFLLISNYIKFLNFQISSGDKKDLPYRGMEPLNWPQCGSYRVNDTMLSNAKSIQPTSNKILFSILLSVLLIFVGIV